MNEICTLIECLSYIWKKFNFYLLTYIKQIENRQIDLFHSNNRFVSLAAQHHQVGVTLLFHLVAGVTLAAGPFIGTTKQTGRKNPGQRPLSKSFCPM